MENPFTFKAGQVFTGFGIGCGVGVGVGRPLNLGAIPALQQVMIATRGATDAFSGVGRHVNGALRNLGMKSIEAGVGCGVGIGHGFGVGIAIKTSVLHQIQSSLGQAVTKVMMKFGVAPGLIMGQNILPQSLQNSIPVTSMQKPIQGIAQLGQVAENELRDQIETKTDLLIPKGTTSDISLRSRSEKVLSNFLQNPILEEEERLEELAGSSRNENNVLQVLLKHQRVLDELMSENENLRKILVEDLKVSPSKFQTGRESRISYHDECDECFECRRRKRKSK